MINISSLITLIIIIASVRFFSVADTLKTNLDIIFRPGTSVNSVYYSSKVLFGIIAIIALVFFIKTLKRTDGKVKNGFFFLLLIFYVISGLSQRDVYKNYSYLYVLQAYNIKFSDLIPFFEQDLFFEEPYIFWFILLMCGIFYVLRTKNMQEYAIPLWIIPFYFLDFPLNCAFVLYGITLLIIAIFGFKYCKNSSAIYYHCFQFLIYLIIVLYAYYSSFWEDRIILIYSLEILFIYFVLSTSLIFYLIKNKTRGAIASTWMIPAATFILIAMPMHKSELYSGLTISTSIVNSLFFLGNISIVVSFVLLLALIAGKISNKLKMFTFYSLSSIVIYYYIIDSFLYHYSHFRINQQTLAWTMAMDDIVGTTVKTCLNYTDFTTWLLIFLSIVIIALLLKNSNKLFKKQSSFRFFCLAFILSSQICSMLFPIVSKVAISELQDPFYSMLKGVELFKKSKGLSDDEIKAGFAECKVPVKEYNNTESLVGNGYNCIFVTLESVHWRYLDMFCQDKQTWPEMSKYKERMEIFPNFYSCFPESTTGDVTVVSGLQAFTPNNLMNKNILTCPTVADELKKLNYETYLFTSGSIIDGNLISIVKTMNFDSVLTYTSSMVKNQEDCWYWGIKEEKNVKNIIEALKKRDSKNPYFVWYRTVYPHAPFTVFEKPQDRVFQTENILVKNVIFDYKNCLIYLDKQLAKLVSEIDKIDKETNKKTILFFVADHGEMLGEKDNFGLFGHGLYAQSRLTNCPFIILYPDAKGFKVNKKFGSQIDVLPTMLDCLDIKPSVKRFEFGESLIRNTDNNRPIYLTSVKSYALVENGYYYYFIDKAYPQCLVEKIELDQNYKAVFKRIEIKENKDKKAIIEKYNRIKKYYELQEEFSLRY
ncbi:MAG: sulfatase-like hydrolase/transferase [Candidatus Riflebacteria bacterium]|nr:sulfatase-like hydrolase/transferase [Candidatus Riflebacteria bacterium]